MLKSESGATLMVYHGTNYVFDRRPKTPNPVHLNSSKKSAEIKKQQSNGNQNMDKARSITGTFYKQQWGGRKGDEAIPSGEEEFDATSTVLLLPLDELIELEDNSEETDEIGREHVSWDGPCSVHITDSVCDFFSVTAVEEITQAMLEKARSEFEPQPSQTESITLTVNLKVRVQPGTNLDAVIEDLNYSFTSGTIGAVIVDTEIRDHEILAQNYERPRG